MSQLLDLQVEITTRLPDTSPETGAPITLCCEALKLKYSGGMFSYPLTKNEQEDLRWYLEDYWKWPFEGFARRGSIVEQLLPMLGQRLYQATFGEGAARNLIQQWKADTSGAHQISIVTTDAGFLSLPWELLHDGYDFLALQENPPISIVRRIVESQQPSSLLPEIIFEKPLHILLITARPVDEGQVDARLIAREVVDVLQEEKVAGAIELEFLRPPTFDELIKRLSQKERPVHVLHFDGHGVFYRFPGNQNGNDEERGRLFFEKEKDGTGDSVDATSLAEMLRYGDVPIAVLNACQSAAIGERDIYSSVAVQLLNGGLQAVVAMSASVLATSAALYVKAFYGALAAGGSIQAAHEQAQRALREHPERNPLQRRLDEAGKPVNLQDWWLSYLYLQHPLELRPTSVSSELKLPFTPSSVRLSESTPVKPRYGFHGRACELLTIERWLVRGTLIVVHGFGGIGKTALAREAADWLTQTGMYQGACFVSFEGGRGNARSLLGQLGFFLGVYDGTYTPDDPKAALKYLKIPLNTRRTLVIADNLESILPGGEAPLGASELTELWNVLLSLRDLGAGVLLTTRTTAFEDRRLWKGTQVVHLRLGGLGRDDAYQLASSLLISLQIDRRRAEYQPLQDFLQQLGYHPLSIQLVLPALRSHELVQIQQNFAALLPQFTGDAETERNRSLLASLSYSLRELTEEQRVLLSRLTVFEGGASENNLLAITQISEADWAELRNVLEQAALLMVEKIEGVNAPFLHFHPVLIPFLRGQPGTQNEILQQQYAQRYYEDLGWFHHEDSRYPLQIRAIVQRELPNLRRALDWLLKSGDLDKAVEMARWMNQFLTIFGLYREQQQLLQRVKEVLDARKPVGTLTQAEYLHEVSLGEEEQHKGHPQKARTRFQKLLARIKSQPKGSPLGPGSFEHAFTLGRLSRYFGIEGNISEALQMCQQAIALWKDLVQRDPKNRDVRNELGSQWAEQGNILFAQRQYTEAKKAYEQSLRIKEEEDIGDLRGQTVARSMLGAVALEQRDYLEARRRYEQVIYAFHVLKEPSVEADAWHGLGRVAQEEKNWSLAERCYRQCLLLSEQLGNDASVFAACNQLGQIAMSNHRFEEAKGWFQHAVKLTEQADPTNERATCLSNLIDCLIQEVQAGTVQDVSLQLEEARRYTEQALAIRQTLHSPALWRTFGNLATIADMQGHYEEARAYRWKSREVYASFADHRSQIDQRFGQLFPALVAAQNDLKVRAQMEEVLSQAEENGWHVREAIEAIWAGERDWQILAQNLNGEDAFFVLRVLETFAERADPEIQAHSLMRRLSTLPSAMRLALALGDKQAFQQAFEALSVQEQQTVMEFIDFIRALQTELRDKEEDTNSYKRLLQILIAIKSSLSE